MANKIRIAQITHDLAIGGLQQVVVNLCRSIDRDRFDMLVLCLSALGPLVAEIERLGIDVQLIESGRRPDYLAFLKVARVLRSQRIDVVHTHNTQPFIDGTLGALLAGGATVVHTDHARRFPDKRRYMVAEWLMSQFAYRVVGVSEHTTQNLARFERIPRRRLLTIPNGVDGARFEITVDSTRARGELGVHPDAPLVGFAGRLTPQKGLTHLLTAMAEVRRSCPRATLVIVGEGPLEHELRRLSVELRIADAVRFVGPRLDIPFLLKLFDVCVLPSLWEGLPMVVLEAMAAGCPVVASDVGGVSSAITSGVNGALVRPEDAHALAFEIIRMLGDSSLRCRYASAGLALFRERYSAAAMTRRYEELYCRWRAHAPALFARASDESAVAPRPPVGVELGDGDRMSRRSRLPMA